MKLSDIGVRVEVEGPEGGLGGGTVAILHEVLAMLERLLDAGEEGAIDLRSLPMAPAELDELSAALGEGELDAVFTGGGRSRVRETGVHGVWWVEHRDPDDKIIASFIEITTVPAILITDPADIRRGIDGLHRRLAQDAAGREERGGQAND
ncbi:MAG TPA: hydrogenase expression/formation C-terminal domain-containing protein [Gammaproteobacteria bacterium]|nr:hydrogenase expression/formation C-terminal domain-containing protein [Gammaproteobacteria bacterium]